MKLSNFEKWQQAKAVAEQIEMNGVFDDVQAAIEEAVELADEHGAPFCIVRARDLLGVVSYDEARRQGLAILETVTPTQEVA